MARKILFLSYSHDSDEHRERVLALSEQLRKDGFETRLDQYVNGAPSKGWIPWMLDQVDEADHVLVICTATYYRRFRRREEPGKGSGAIFESSILAQKIYDAQGDTLKFVPVLFDDADRPHVPEPLQGRMLYVVSTKRGYVGLRRFLKNLGDVTPGPIGEPVEEEERRGEPLVFPDDVPPSPVSGEARSAHRRRSTALVVGAAAAALAAAVGGPAAYRACCAEPTDRSVAILPLRSGGDGGTGAMLSDGITREVITRLASIEGLRVLDINAVERYRRDPKPLPQVARELRVAHVVDGSLQQAAERVRILAYMRNHRDQQLWTDTFNTVVRDVFAVQSEVARQIAEELRETLTEAEIARLATPPTRSVDAYARYTEGRAHLYRDARRQENNEIAIGRFEEAVRLDPAFGLAYGGLARAYEERSQREGMEAWYDSALATARRGVGLAPEDERTHASLGYVLRAGGRHREALRVLLKAAELAPSGGDASGRSNLGLVCQEIGRPDEAVRWHLRATALEPTSSTARMRAGIAYEALGDYGSAEREYLRAIEIDSAAPAPRFRLATLYRMRGEAARGEPVMDVLRRLDRGWDLVFEWEAQNGRWARAEEAWARWQASGGRGLRSVPPLLAMMQRARGDSAGAEATLASIERLQADRIARGDEGHLPRLLLAQVHALRGEPDAAVARLREAVRSGYLNAQAAAHHPALATLRGRRDFQALLQEMRATASRLRERLAASTE